MTPEHDDEVTALRPTLGEAPGAVKESRFDPRSASPFVEKSLSEHTRRAYHLALTEFFRHAGMKHPSAVTPADVINWRDGLVRNKRKAATICFKLSVVRSFFEHLRASGLILLNPTSTKSVASPALPEGAAGRALSPREASGEGTLILWLCTQAREQCWRQREAIARQQQRQAEWSGRSQAEFSQLADSLSGD